MLIGPATFRPSHDVIVGACLRGKERSLSHLHGDWWLTLDKLSDFLGVVCVQTILDHFSGKDGKNTEIELQGNPETAKLERELTALEAAHKNDLAALANSREANKIDASTFEKPRQRLQEGFGKQSEALRGRLQDLQPKTAQTAAKGIGELHDYAVANKAGENRSISYRKVDVEESGRLQSATGQTFEGFSTQSTAMLSGTFLGNTERKSTARTKPQSQGPTSSRSRISSLHRTPSRASARPTRG